MLTARTRVKARKTSRSQELKTILERRRSELLHALQDRIRAARSERITDRDVLDGAESSELDIQNEIGFALIQLKTETLSQVDAALRRLEEGKYGGCCECGEEIAEARLRAHPFALRCKDCEQSRESAGERERVMAERRGASALFPDLGSWT
jgi:DnaK suppressor protein